LKRARHLAVRAERLSHVPHIPMLTGDNARQSFVEQADFFAIREQLPIISAMR
jgi:hypothetical protein